MSLYFGIQLSHLAYAHETFKEWDTFVSIAHACILTGNSLYQLKHCLSLCSELGSLLFKSNILLITRYFIAM